MRERLCRYRARTDDDPPSGWRVKGTGGLVAARRNLEETRDCILDAGVELLAEADYSFDTANLSLIDACRRAGLGTAGSGYKIWSSQQEFRADVLRRLLVTGGSTMFRTDRLIAAAQDASGDLDVSSLIRVTSNENAAATIGSKEFARYVAVWSTAANDEDLRADLLAAQEEQFATLTELYRALMEVFDREMVPPFTVEMLLRSMTAQAEGMAMSFAYRDELGIDDIKRPTGPNGELERWHLFSSAIEALAEAFTRPRRRDETAE